MKKIFSIFAVVSALMTAFSCGPEEQPSQPKEEAVPSLQGIQVMPRTNYLVIGDTVTLEVQYAPETAQPGTVAWSSLDGQIATVSSDGVVTAHAPGVVLVLAEVDGKVSSTVINVVGERVPATGIVLSKTEASIIAGRSTQIKATLEPENTTDKLDITWTSSNENVATVSYGAVLGLSMGEVTVTASQGGLKAVCTVSVGDKIKLQDRSDAWTFSHKASWQKDWWGSITGSVVDVTLEECDAALHYFQIVDADTPVDIEAVAANVDMQVEEYQDAGRDPSSLFSKNVPESKSTTSMGEKYAYVLGYDEEFGFTGEYALYPFTAAEPDPVHATGIRFTSGWNDDTIESINLVEGKSLSMFSAVLLPDDCTDTGSISFKSSDESVVTLSPYYDRYYTVRAVGAGETFIVAKFNDIEASIPVTVTSNNVNINFKDRSADWSLTARESDNGWYTCTVTLLACDDPYHLIYSESGTQDGFDIKKSYNACMDDMGDYLSYYVSNRIPEETSLWDSGKIRVIVFGFDAQYNCTGNYAVKFIDTDNLGGGDILADEIRLTPSSATVEAGSTVTLTATLLPENHTDNPVLSWESDDESVATVSGGVVTGVAPGSATVTVRAGDLSAQCAVTVTAASVNPEGKIVSMGDNYFSVDWPSDLETLDEVTMEGWVYGDSFMTGGNDNLHVMMGVEGIFQIRFERNKPEVIFGTSRKDNGEYNEGKVTCSTTLDDKRWYHLAATYKNGGDVILYIDGEKAGSATASDHGIDMNGVGAGWAGGGLADWHFFIGVGCQTPRDFDGSMAHLRVWKSVRTEAQIKAAMKSSSVSGSDLIGWWKFDEGAGDTVKDHSGAGRDITANSTLKWIDGTRPF